MAYKPNKKLSAEKQALHAEAKRRFDADRSKCFQRHLREVQGEKANREKLKFDGTERIVRVPIEQARAVIEDHEWFGTTCPWTVASYALVLHGEILGALSLSKMGRDASNICGEANADKIVHITRGACVDWAPQGAASKLIRWSCMLAHADKELRYSVFVAYSDSEAGEVGTVYQAAGFRYKGRDLGRSPDSFHVDFSPPIGTESEPVTSYKLNHDEKRELYRRLGWDETKGPPRLFLKRKGWTPEYVYGKGVYVLFVGSPEERAELEAACKYPDKPYPRRNGEET